MVKRASILSIRTLAGVGPYINVPDDCPFVQVNITFDRLLKRKQGVYALEVLPSDQPLTASTCRSVLLALIYSIDGYLGKCKVQSDWKEKTWEALALSLNRSKAFEGFDVPATLPKEDDDD